MRERAIRGHIRNFLYPMTEAEMMVVLDEAVRSGDSVRTKYINEYVEECRNGPDGFAG